MLRAGVEIAVDYATEASDEAVSAVMAHIRLTDVAERASQLEIADGNDAPPITTGSLYQHWASQPEFQTDLLLHVIGLASFPGADESLPVAMRLIADGATVEEALARSGQHDFVITRDKPLTYVELSAYAVAANPRVKSALSESFRHFDERIIGLYELSLRLAGRRMKAPHEVAHLAWTIGAAIDGFVVRHRACPETVPDDLGDGLGLVAHSVLAIWNSFTEPV